MRNKIIVSFCLMSLMLCSFIQQSDEDKVHWNSGKLNWDCFKGKPSKISSMDAMSGCHITTNMQSQNDSLIFFIESYFSKTGSWVKEGKQTAYLLNHEQGHFDINEIYARKYRKKISESKFNLSTVIKNSEKIQVKIFELLKREQDLYDKETNHSKNAEKQSEWDNKIEKQLKELEMYDKSKIVVAFSTK